MVTGGRNTGRVGTIMHRERHQGSFDIVHVKVNNYSKEFSTLPHWKKGQKAAHPIRAKTLQERLFSQK